MELLCKLYLELANVVPDDCKSSRELALEKELDLIRDGEYKRARSQFSDVTQAQGTLVSWFRHMRDSNIEELRKSFGSVGVELLETALKDIDSNQSA